MKKSRLVLLLAAAQGLVPAVWADEAPAAYPSHAIRLVVPYTAGGSADALGRAVGQALSTAWKQTVIIDNRPGADGLIGADAVARSHPDGYTLLYGPNALYSIFPYMHPKAATDARRDLDPVAGVSIAPMVLAVSTTIAATTVPQLIAYAKSKPGQVSYGSAGNSSLPRMMGETFARLAGVKMVHVPYKGTSQAATDLAGGQIQVLYGSLTSIEALVKAGKARLLAVTSAKRFADLPDLPALTESLPGWKDLSTFQGIFAPKGMSPVIANRISAALQQASQSPEFLARLRANAFANGYAPPAEFKSHLDADYTTMGEIIRAAGISPED